MDHFQRGGLTFDLRDGGPVDGEPVLLLHGFPQDSSSWSAVAPLLHAAGLRTLAPDQRGYSPGARPPRPADYRVVELVGDILALLDAADLPSAHIVGHDWGGVIAWQLADRYPERVRSLTVLSTPHPRALQAAMRSGKQALKSWYILFFQLPVVPEFVLARTLERLLLRSGLPAEFAVHNARRMREPGALTGALNWYRALRVRSPRPHPTAPTTTSVRTITVPTTYIWSRHDAFLGATAAHQTAHHVTAPYRFEELNASHWLPETHPAEVATLIIERLRTP